MKQRMRGKTKAPKSRGSEVKTGSGHKGSKVKGAKK